MAERVWLSIDERGGCHAWINRGGNVQETSIEMYDEAMEDAVIYRASGDMVCACGKEYWRHPAEEHAWGLAVEFPCTLRRLCNGDLVKT